MPFKLMIPQELASRYPPETATAPFREPPFHAEKRWGEIDKIDGFSLI